MPGWLLIRDHVPTQPSALRVSSRRAPKQLGPSCSGPARVPSRTRPRFETLSSGPPERIVEGGGATIAFTAAALTEDDHRAIELKSKAARHDEYRQVVKSFRTFCAPVEQEDDDRDYRFAEVGSLDEELNKVRRPADASIGTRHRGHA